MHKILSGKIAIVTGANQGFGLEIARKYVLSGANVMLCARNATLLKDVVAELGALAGTGQKIIAKDR